MARWRQIGLIGAAVVLAPLTAACSGGGSKTPDAGTIGSAVSSHLAATRWWSNSAAQVGSTIDVKNPEAAAAKLSASPTDYCGMLRQTVAAGHSILPGVTANDPALLASTKAFMAELEAVAPSSVAGAWKVLGPAVLTIVESGGDPAKVKGVDAPAVQKAAGMVAADAKHSCGVDLS